MDKLVGYRSPGRKELAAETHGHSTSPDAAPRMQMGDDVPAVVREDREFQLLFRESQKIKNSKRPADQKHLANLLNQMRARWAELTREGASA